jgi:hypothetical protein
MRRVGMVLAALPLFAGYLLILFDRRRPDANADAASERSLAEETRLARQ